MAKHIEVNSRNRRWLAVLATGGAGLALASVPRAALALDTQASWQGIVTITASTAAQCAGVGGSTVENVRDFVNPKVSDYTAAQLAKRPIEYDTGFTLLPGKYSIKLLARDDDDDEGASELEWPRVSETVSDPPLLS